MNRGKLILIMLLCNSFELLVGLVPGNAPAGALLIVNGEFVITLILSFAKD